MPKKNCLVCDEVVNFNKKGWFSSDLNISGFCGGCGVEFHSTCPKCDSAQVDLKKFCASCGHDLYASKNTPQKQTKEQTATKEQKIDSQKPKSFHIIEKMKVDLNDSRFFIYEFLIIYWRFNIVNQMFRNFASHIQTIDETMENHQKVEAVRNAINCINFENVGDNFAELLDIYSESLHKILVESMLKIESYDENMYEYISQHVEEDIEDIVQDFVEDIANTILSGTSDYELIIKRHNQLMEFFPRYNDIMTRNDVFEMVLAFAAGFLGGPLAVSGLEIWDGWRTSNDDEFMKKFSFAIDDLAQCCINFLDGIEVNLSGVFTSFIDEYEDREKTIIDKIVDFVEAGWDLDEFYLHLSKSEPLDEDGRELIKLIINNLKNRGDLSTAQIKNIKRLTGLR